MFGIIIKNLPLIFTNINFIVIMLISFILSSDRDFAMIFYSIILLFIVMFSISKHVAYPHYEKVIGKEIQTFIIVLMLILIFSFIVYYDYQIQIYVTEFDRWFFTFAIFIGFFMQIRLLKKRGIIQKTKIGNEIIFNIECTNCKSNEMYMVYNFDNKKLMDEEINRSYICLKCGAKHLSIDYDRYDKKRFNNAFIINEETRIARFVNVNLSNKDKSLLSHTYNSIKFLK